MKNGMPQEEKLLEALGRQFPDSSKNNLRTWIEKGRVTVDGTVSKRANQLVRVGAEIALAKKNQPIDFDVQVLYEDRHLVVICKPQGLLSVAAKFDSYKTAHSILKRRVHPGRVFPVHRLDRETSGVMLFTYTEEAREGLKEAFEKHDIEREYCALVEGVMASSKGTWKSYLVEDPTYVVRSHDEPDGGALSITHFELLKQHRNTAQLRLILETGRKNQIRVHCKDAGHPVVGDKKYGATNQSLGRLALHACKLGFIHPVTQKKMLFESPAPF
jgi:23S rRNA pseudouridine1911/1915/1917 synthase